MSGEEQQQQLVPGTEPWVYQSEVEMLNGHNRDVPPQPAVLVVEEPETEVVQAAATPSGSGDVTPGGSRIFIQAPQYQWHTVTSAGTDAEARERLVALEQKVFAFGQQTEEREEELLAWIAQLEAQRGSADEDYRAFRQQLGVDGQQLAKALQTLEGRVDQAAGKQSVLDSVHEMKAEIHRVEQEAIRARQVIDQRLKGYEDAGAWTREDLTTEFGKWQAMHRESVRQVFEEQSVTMEQRLVGMEKAVGELKGLQTQMAEFQTSQDSAVQMLTRMESQIAKLDWVDVEVDDEEERVEEKDQEPGTSQSTGPPPTPAFPSAIYSAPETVADSVSSPAFNLPPPCLSPISEKSAQSSPPTVSDVKGKVRTEAPPTMSYTADLPHPSAATMGTTAGTSTGAPLGIGQLKLEGPARYSGGRKPSVRAWLVEVDCWTVWMPSIMLYVLCACPLDVGIVCVFLRLVFPPQCRGGIQGTLSQFNCNSFDV